MISFSLIFNSLLVSTRWRAGWKACVMEQRWCWDQTPGWWSLAQSSSSLIRRWDLVLGCCRSRCCQMDPHVSCRWEIKGWGTNYLSVRTALVLGRSFCSIDLVILNLDENILKFILMFSFHFHTLGKIGFWDVRARWVRELLKVNTMSFFTLTQCVTVK